jgi:rod shape determining protein RodA
MNHLLSQRPRLDGLLIAAVFIITGAGLLTVHSFSGAGSPLLRQGLATAIAIAIGYMCSRADARILRSTSLVASLFVGISGILALLFVLGKVAKGAQSWFSLGFFSFQPSDVAKIVLIIVLAKYFSRRHIEIAHFQHIIVSGIYAFIIFMLVLLQPDFGSAMTIFLIWLGMVLVSGISKKHIVVVGLVGAVTFAGLWGFGFKEYQKNRIRNFVHPLADIHGSGYNAYQSVIAVGSGGLMGKGWGFGTQSRLKFLPEYQTDFVFAAFAEEWGFVGVMILFAAYGVLVWRIIVIARTGSSNLEILFGVGVALYILVHFTINVGMNIGLLPVTGITLPFMSYGGSHVVAEWAALGLLFSMDRYSRVAHRDDIKNEFIGPA